ncbi:hypothetical protein HanHA300_Chr01g0026051 [Helianthus annuus]|nr:hypothetical protein HanHA300_Chr01g0026051 [Helianthus annuus]
MMRALLCTFFFPSHLHLPSERLSSARASVAPARYSGNNKSGSWLHLGQGHAANFPILVRFDVPKDFHTCLELWKIGSQYHVIRFNSVGGNANFNIEIAIRVDPGSRTYREWDRANCIVDRVVGNLANYVTMLQLEEEEKLHKQQSETLKTNYKKYELIDGVQADGNVNRLKAEYGITLNDH